MLAQLLVAEPQARRRALRLLKVTWPEQALATWERWWNGHERLFADARRALGELRPRVDRVESFQLAGALWFAARAHGHTLGRVLTARVLTGVQSRVDDMD